MKKITLLFVFLSCFLGSAQIIEFQNIDFKNYLLGANVSNGRASTGTATFNPVASLHSEQNPLDIPFDSDPPYSLGYFEPNFSTSFLFQVQSYNVIDTNGDGEIQISEAEAITYLNLDNLVFSDTVNLNYFVNLKYLGLEGTTQQEGFIDFSQNTELEMLNTSNSELYGYSVSQNIGLTHYIGSNAEYLPDDLFSTYRPNLVFLNISRNSFAPQGADCSQFPALEELYINYNNIYFDSFSSINISQNLALKRLFIQGGNVNNIDISQHSLLSKVGIRYVSNLNNLDLSNKPFLNHVYCAAGANNIDVSNCPLLEELYLRYTNSPYVDLSDCESLKILDLYGSNFEIIDVSECPDLTNLEVRSNASLVYLNVKNNNPSIIPLFINSENENLQYICADEEDIDSIQNTIISAANFFPNFGLNIEVNSYCTFNPGGSSETFYEVTGDALIVDNETNCEDATDYYSFLKFNIFNGTNTGIFFSNQTGNYYTAVVDGSYTLTPIFENTDYFSIAPNNLTFNFTSSEDSLEQNFCITPNGIHHDLEVTIIPLDVAVPGFDYSCKILYKNKGNQPENPSLSLAFDDSVVDFLTSSIVPDTESGGLLSWDLGTLNVFETGSIIVNFNLNSPMETPPLNSGDIIGFLSTIEGAFDDETQDNNFFNLKQDVVNSYDPNDKTCLEGQSIHPEMIGEFVHYRIRFENTGTFPACKRLTSKF